MAEQTALDTDRLTDLLRGDAELAEQLSFCKRVWIPLVVLGEIRAGFLAGMRSGHNERRLWRLLAQPTVELLLADRETAEQYARLWVQLKRAGTPIPDNHLWIAALALQHGLRLVTRDAHFEKIPQLLLG
ncbi:MAG TPA: type II toxin-antitoxin system VapC family toxin [Terriglobales bacterium]|nr:type II toxin-antitoxin system VapC family toxin [Terriglobales bacterium]